MSHMAMPTNGNAGELWLPTPGAKSSPRSSVQTIRRGSMSAKSRYRGHASIASTASSTTAARSSRGQGEVGWFDISTLKEPYRIEGKKTMGLELAEQLGWQLPDVILYPTGGGTGLIGMWKAFDEIEAGFIGTKRPRMVAVQAAGCAPMVRAYEAGDEHARRWENAHTVAAGIRVPQAVGDFLILRAVRESGGFAIAVPDDAIIAAHRGGRGRRRLFDVPGGRSDLCSAQAGACGRPYSQRRRDRAVQLRHGTEISSPAGTPDARSPPADRLRRFVMGASPGAHSGIRIARDRDTK